MSASGHALRSCLRSLYGRRLALVTYSEPQPIGHPLRARSARRRRTRGARLTSPGRVGASSLTAVRPARRPAHTAVYAPLATRYNRTITILILCRIAQAHHFSTDIIAMPEFQECPDRAAARSSRETRRAANQSTPRQCGLHSTIWYRGDRHRSRQGPVGRRADQR
jgi:hypothetical protein